MVYSINILELAGGLGLFLFSLRFLTSILDRSMSSRFRPLLSRFLATPWRCVLAGFCTTLLVQASSISIITAMGLVNSSLITLEQGFFAMLGATVGTTIKAWLFAREVHVGPALVGISSIAYLFVRRPLIREALEVLLAVGLTFLGLDMMGQGLVPFRNDPVFLKLFQIDGLTLGTQSSAILTGCLMTMAVQSSSAIVFIILDLAGQGIVSLPGGAALILGANIGTTLTALIASIEVGWNGKRLALTHFVVKLTGVLVTLFFFPLFLALIDGVFGLLAPQAGVAFRLAAVHSGFNLLNTAVWALLSGLLLRFLSSVTPPESVQGMALPIGVRRMLAHSPERALAEADRQSGQLQLLCKTLTDTCFHLLLEYPSEDGKKKRPLLPKDLNDVKEGLNDLLFQLMRHPRASARLVYIQQLLRFTDSCAALYHISLAMRAHLERGLLLEYYVFPTEFHLHLETFQKHFDMLWLCILFENALLPDYSLSDVINTLEGDYFAYLQQHRDAKPDHLSWLYDTIGFFRQIARQLEDMYRQKQQLSQQ